MSYFKKVLLIDDDASSNFLNTLIIRESGFSEAVDVCINGREGLEYLRSDSPQAELIFLDLNMPVMNGFEFLEELRHDIGVVVLTASQDPADLKRIQAFPIIACMPKPITAEKLQQLYSARCCA